MLLIEGILTNAAIVISTGVFLSGYIVFLQGTDFLVGILNSSINWAAMLSLFSFLVYERLKRRKKLLIILYSISRLLTGTIVFIPLISKNNTVALGIVSGMVIIGNIVWGIYSIGFTVWMISLLPNDRRKQFIYLRMLLLRISFTIVTIVMAIVLDWSNKSYTGFLIVFSAGIVLSIINIVILSNISEPENVIVKKEGFNKETFFEPLKNKSFRKYLIFIFLFYFSITMSSSFTPLYQIKYLNLGYGFISIINVIMYTCMIAFTRFWGRIEVKKGTSTVFRATILFLALDFLIYSFLQSKTTYLIFLAATMSGIGNSGFNVSILTYRYELIPEHNKTIYEGWYSAVFGLGTITAPIVGGILLDMLPTFGNNVYQFSNFQLLYLISFTLIISVTLIFFYGFKKKRLIQD